jgi:hypothetical protein
LWSITCVREGALFEALVVVQVHYGSYMFAGVAITPAGSHPR